MPLGVSVRTFPEIYRGGRPFLNVDWSIPLGWGPVRNRKEKGSSPLSMNVPVSLFLVHHDVD